MSATTATTTSTMPLANSTVPLTNYNSNNGIDVDDVQDDVQDDVTASTVTSKDKPKSTNANTNTNNSNNNNNNNNNTPLSSLSSKHLDQIFHSYWNTLQQHHDQMSAVEIIRTATTMETIWKQRYHSSIYSQNQNTKENMEKDGVVDSHIATTTTTSSENDNDIVLTNFNIVLRAWCKTCQLLLEFHDQNTVMMIPTIPTTTTISSALSPSPVA